MEHEQQLRAELATATVKAVASAASATGIHAIDATSTSSSSARVQLGTQLRVGAHEAKEQLRVAALALLGDQQAPVPQDQAAPPAEDDDAEEVEEEDGASVPAEWREGHHQAPVPAVSTAPGPAAGTSSSAHGECLLVATLLHPRLMLFLVSRPLSVRRWYWRRSRRWQRRSGGGSNIQRRQEASAHQARKV